MATRKQPTKAVITGAAGGFGNCFSERLAALGHDLVLIDQRGEALMELCDRLESTYQIHAEGLAIDLTEQHAVESLAQRLSKSSDIEYLVNNVGFAHLQDFVEIRADEHLEMVALHVTTPLLLTRAVLPGMIRHDQGNIINVSSLGAWLPSRDAQYAATKSYLVVLSQALHEELHGTQVRVQALCPSFVNTRFHNTEKMKQFPRRSIPRGMWMSPEAVVDYSLSSLQRNRALVIPGWKNRVFSLGLRMPLMQPLIRRLLRKKNIRRQTSRKPPRDPVPGAWEKRVGMEEDSQLAYTKDPLAG